MHLAKTERMTSLGVNQLIVFFPLSLSNIELTYPERVQQIYKLHLMKFLKHAENIDSLEKVQMYHISGINQQEDYN